MKYTDLKAIIDGEDVNKSIEVLKSQAVDVPIDDYKNQWDTDKHAVCDESIREDRKQTVDYEDEHGEDKEKTTSVPVNRVPVPMQKNIVGKAASFLFGNPVKILSSAPNGVAQETLEAVTAAVNKILEDTKSDSRNRVIAKDLFRSTQVAEVWYPVDQGEQHEDYGFPTKYKLRMAVFSPWYGDKLFPFFDDTKDLIAFSREFVMKDEKGVEITHFEVYTAEFYQLWKRVTDKWEIVGTRQKSSIGAIPVVFSTPDVVEWQDVQKAIERLETILSNHADTNDYNGSPTIVGEGEIESVGEKGPGNILQVEKGGKLYYLSWDHAPESIKLEIDNLFRIIHTYTQTPDISFENVKGINSITGIALKLLFMDAHLKVMDKRETFDPHLKRRLNIIKKFIGMMNTSLKPTIGKVRIDAEIVPFMIEDPVEKVTALTIANGGKPILSQKASVEKADLVSDKGADYEQIVKEAKEARTAAAFNIE